MRRARPSSQAFTVLFVCTGNVCRSALAERLARAYLDEALGVERAAAVRFLSAGTRAVVDSGMHPDTALVLRGLGVGSGDFRAQQLHSDLVRGADLILAMTRRHRDGVLALVPRALPRTFLLREAAALLDRLPAPRLPEDEPTDRLSGLVAAMAAARGRRVAGPVDDVADPIGRPLEVQQQVGEAITEALVPVLDQFVAALAAAGAGRLSD